MACNLKEYKTAFTFEALYALEKAIVEGALRVKYSDKEIEYRSMEDLVKARDMVAKRLGVTKKCGDAGIFGGSRIVAVHSKGLNDCD
jgi:hypothetical protein